MIVILKQCLKPGGSRLNTLAGEDLQLENNRSLDGDVSRSPGLHPGERMTIVRRITKHRSGGRLIRITHRVVYGDPNEVPSFLGLNTAYVERTNLTSRQMNGRMVRKTLSFSKEEEMLKASCALEDMVYNYGRPLKSLREESNSDQRQWDPRSPAMAAGITDHIWTIDEMMMLLVVPESINA